MGYILLAVFLLVAVILLSRPRKKENKPRSNWPVVFIILIICLLLLVISGRLPWLLGAGAALLTQWRKILLVLRMLPFLRRVLGKAKNKANAESLPYLKVLGGGDAEILCGEHQHKHLSELSSDQLIELHQSAPNPTTKNIIGDFLAARHDDAWYEYRLRHDFSAATLSSREAAQVLRLSLPTDKASVLHAHRKLMAQHHPDKGGDDHVASLLNAARDLLNQDQ